MVARCNICKICKIWLTGIVSIERLLLAMYIESETEIYNGSFYVFTYVYTYRVFHDFRA